MIDASPFYPIAAAGLGVAMAHAAIPTHWLPFVLTARSHGWGTSKTLSITAAAGLGHVLFTTLLGALLLWLGLEVDEWIGHVFPFVAGGVLIAFGIYHLFRRGHRHLLGLPRVHNHNDCEACEHAEHAMPAGSLTRTDAAAIGSLFVMLTLSPCESFLPVYLSATSFGWTGFVLLSLVLGVGTIAAMVVLTGLTLSGVVRLRTALFERYENVIIGVLLCLLGIGVILLEQGHHHHH